MILTSKSGENTLLFDTDKHLYTLNDKPVSGVTTINKKGYPINPGLLRWMMSKGIKESNEISKKAANIGTLLHNYAEEYETSKKISEELHDTIITHKDCSLILKCIKKFRRWEKDNHDEIIASEELVASVKYQYGGTCDRLAKRNGQVILSDFKTSSGIYTEHFIQVAAYALALYEWKQIVVDGLEIIRFGKDDGAFETKLITNRKQMKALQEQFIRNLKTSRFIEAWSN